MMDTIKMGRLKWHHILNPNEEDFSFLKDKYHFHPLDIEDCRSVNQRPKIDIYDDYYFLILHFPNFDRQNVFVKTKEIKIFWGEDFIISLEKSPWITGQLFSEYKERDDNDEDLDIGTSDALLYRVLERLMRESLYLLRKVGLDLELINRELFGNKQVKIIERISVTRKNIILINTIFKPQLRLFHKFETGQVSGFADNMEDYWGNILDYYQKMWDMTEDYEDLIEGLSKTFDSMQTNKTNEIVKILTLISSIILPLTFITSLYGMNVMLPLAENKTAFWGLLIGMVSISALMILYFKRKRWM
ncbi:MAG: magnesium transporter CorA family protein [Bacteroidetes bacterium]|jgi:magnesium transporter|nr:magnesium transporter CorA family protein [Bacteroidota bacterium]MBU1577979.1 magnesium transporter CorA family protein [Bacteroidota bacterium]MDA3942247.1 magnesium transporter CorA family protein [Bacteroidota bacterium]